MIKFTKIDQHYQNLSIMGIKRIANIIDKYEPNSKEFIIRRLTGDVKSDILCANCFGTHDQCNCEFPDCFIDKNYLNH